MPDENEREIKRRLILEDYEEVKAPEPGNGADPEPVSNGHDPDPPARSEGVPMTRAEKRALVGRLLAERPEASDREIARLAGVDHKTVAALRQGGEFQIPHPAEFPHSNSPVGNSTPEFPHPTSSVGNLDAKFPTPDDQIPHPNSPPGDEIPHPTPGEPDNPEPEPAPEPPPFGDPALRELRIDIGKLSNESTPEEIAVIVDRIAIHVRDAIVRDALLQTIKAQTKTASVQTMRKQIDQIIKAAAHQTPIASGKKITAEADLRDLILRFNGRYAVVNEAGKAWVFRWNFDPALKREVLERTRFSDFLRLYENRIVTILKPDGQEATKTLAQWWLQSPLRQQYLGGVTFNPTGKAPDGYMNLWRGFAVQPKAGDWSLMREHIEKVLCSGIKSWSDYVLDWSAHAVQHPHTPGEVALVFRGTEGCGKGTYGRWFAKIFGQHGLQIISPEQLVGRFNEHLRDCILLFADEAFYAGDQKHEGILRGLITEPFLTVEGKGIKVVVVPNMLHVILSSNSKWVVPAAAAARRYAIFDVTDSRVGNLDYFAKINEQMLNGGLPAMLHDLQQRDISKFEVRKFPQTAALAAQKKYSLDTISRWWLAVLERGFVWRSRYGLNEFSEWMEFCSTQLLYSSYLQWCGESRVSYPETQVALGVWFTEVYLPSRPKQSHIIGELETWPPSLTKHELIQKRFQAPGYKLNDLEHARARFADIRQVTGDWTEDAP